MGRAFQFQLAVLAGAVGLPLVHEGIVPEIPIHRPIVDVIRPFVDFGAYLVGKQVRVGHDEILERYFDFSVLPGCIQSHDLGIQPGEIEKADVAAFDGAFLHDLAGNVEQPQADAVFTAGLLG